jgi:pyrroloquinoline quinone (PQQ) biosynthesis protein C
VETFWTDLKAELSKRSVTEHPLYVDLMAGTLGRPTLAELCAQFKYTVTDGIACLALIVPQAPRELKKELAENLFGELTGTREVPSHWELALRAGAAAGFTRDDIDGRPMRPETKVYPDTVSAYAMRGAWLEALSFVALGIEDMFTAFCDGATRAVKKHYGYSDAEALYFSAHVGADEEHSELGWQMAAQHATTDEKRRSVRQAALEGRTMWWNMHSAVYEAGERKPAPWHRVEP